jgi:DNA-binding NtrC family response regulator
VTAPLARILIVDDEPRVRGLIADSLRTIGYEVVEAGSAREAITAIGQAPTDVILLDIRMPEVDGVEALRRIKAIAPTVPVVMITGNTDVDVASDTLHMGAFDYLRKPFDLDHLRSVVAAAVVLRRS